MIFSGKKAVSLFVLFCMVLSCVLIPVEQKALGAEIVQITLDTAEIKVDPNVNRINGRFVLPAVEYAKFLKVQYYEDLSTNQAVFKNEQTELILIMDEKLAKVNGEEKKLDATNIAINNRVFAPVRLVAESFGCLVSYNVKTNTVEIQTPEYVKNIKVLSGGTVKSNTYYVSSNGNDQSGTGTVDNPFRSIELARDAARKYKQEVSGDISIILRGGTYTLDQTINLDERDSGVNGNKIIYRAYEGETPIINGGKTISGWVKKPDSNLWTAKADEDFIRQFYVNGQRKQKARTNQMMQGENWYYDEKTNEIGGLVCNSRELANTIGAPDVEISWMVEWRNYKIPIEKVVETNKKQVFLSKAPVFKLALKASPPNTAIKFVRPFYIENALGLLDTPGEWYYDRQNKTIYYWPQEGENMETVTAVVPVVEQLLNISGTTKENKAKNIEFRGITFEYSSWNAPSVEGFYSHQTEWIEYPREAGALVPPAIRINQAENIKFERNIIQHIGSVGIGLYEYVYDSEFVGNVFNDLSDGGLTVGYPQMPNQNKAAVICKRIKVNNNVFYQVGREYYSACGIQGFIVEDCEFNQNTLADMPYSAICVGWGWSEKYGFGGNQIKDNRITGSMQMLRDGGAIYTLGKLTGTIISGNYVNAVVNDFTSVYNDMGTKGILCENNVFENVPVWAFVNFWTEDITFRNNFSDTTASKTNSNVNIFGLDKVNYFPDKKWSNEAKAIIQKSGVAAEFKDLLKVIPVADNGNQAPVIQFESTQMTVPVGKTVLLTPKVVDDGFPSFALKYRWSVFSAPQGTMVVDKNGVPSCQAAALSEPKQAATAVSFNVPGRYIIEYTVTDYDKTTTEKLTFIVQ